MEGATYHITHRCHNREFLLRFARDRDAYRRVLWETKPANGVWALAYCITGNHVHLLLRAQPGAISTWMHDAQGGFAQYYNRRKKRSGAFWEDRYHSTLIDGPAHCEHCMTYVELNMVRARVVPHPREWAWCSYQEWMGCRQRYRLVDIDYALEFLGGHRLDAFQAHYEHRIQDWINTDRMARQPIWTESVAVGDRSFVEAMAAEIAWRKGFDRAEHEDGQWSLRETPTPWLTANKQG